MAKKLSDLLAWGLLLVAIWILTFLTNKFVTIGFWTGIIGSTFLIVTQVVFLWQTYKRRKK